MTIHTKYRPETFGQVVGQKGVVASLQHALEQRRSQAFLFTGPAGTGKTTLARIAAKQVGCDEINEIDAATNTGIEAMRQVIEQAQYLTLTGGNRAFIIDECHALSKAAWQSLLKILEEPPAHVFWFLCTTEANKVPATIKTRCIDYALQPLTRDQLKVVVNMAALGEGIVLPPDVLSLILEESNGSAREALTILAKVETAADVQEARVLMRREAAPVEAIDLARLIFSEQFDLKTLAAMCEKMKDENPESVRIVLFAYATSVFYRSASMKALKVMGALEAPANDLNKMGGIALRLARILFTK